VTSSVVPPATVLDNGTAYSTITVTLLDASGNPVAGKTVALSQGAGTRSTISAASGLSNANGVVTFTVRDTFAETVTYTAIDTTDGVVVTQTAAVIFQGGTVVTSRSTVTANPGTVTADGVSYSVITVTLEDTNRYPVSGKTVMLTAGSGASVISVGGVPGNSTTTNASGQAIFTVTDTTAQAVTYTAHDTTDSINLTSTATVTFVASTANTPTLALTLSIAGPPYTALYNTPFTVTATVTPSGDHNGITFSVSGVCASTGTTTNTATVAMTASSGTCVVAAIVAANTTGTTHYNSATASVTVTATLATQATLTVTGAPASAVYNTTFTVGYSGGSGTGAVTFAATGGCSNVGTLVTMTSGTTDCSITATKAADTNYQSATSDPVTVTATTATGTVTVNCPAAVYNGQPQTCTATTGPTTGLTVDFTYNGSSTAPTAEGSYTVVGTMSDNNYSGSGTATLVITPEPVTATAGSYSAAYNGSVITLPGCTLMGAFTSNLVCTDSPLTVGPDVGAGAVTPVVTETNGDLASNYTITLVPGSWSITQAASSIALSCPPSVVYTGAAVTPCTATVTGPGLSQSLTVTYVNNVNAGTNTATASAP
jgi:hypothetical protein